MDAPGYNIFVAGPPGAGKSSHCRILLTKRAREEAVPADWCYVFNFKDSDQPVALSLPAGTAPAFARHMDGLVRGLQEAVPRAFESQDYARQRQELIQSTRQHIGGMMATVEQAAASDGFVVRQTEQGAFTLHLREDAVAPGSPHQLDQDQRRELENRASELQARLSDAMRTAWVLEQELQKQLHTLDGRQASFTVEPALAALKEKYAGEPAVLAHLGEVGRDMVEHIELFRARGEDGPPARSLNRYRVNVLVSNEGPGAPVVIEHSPTYQNLGGKVDYTGQEMLTDHTMIKAGALHRANGGYLMVQAEHLLRSGFTWDAFKRALLNQEVRIEPPPDQPRLVNAPTLKPQPVPLRVKVVLLGSALVHHQLYAVDEEFRKLFKVKAEFDTSMEWNDESIGRYAAFIASVCAREDLRHFSPAAVARVIEHSARLAEDQEKLSTRFNEVVEVLYEANAWAGRSGASVVDGDHVIRAVREKAARSALSEERTHEAFRRGHLLVDVAGSVAGQVNGLTVVHMGDYAFGLPSRITAQVFMGRKGIVHIERERGVSGSIHQKGVLTLAGYLGGTYALDKPLSLSASLCFEQLYSLVDGDSASSAELFALLSALADLPVNQGIAVTGSVDQRGMIQPVGGVSHKVEGFFRVCKNRGLTGGQGVIIPHQNVVNLMLDPEVVAAVEAGQFHVWAIENVDQGIEILTGVPAGAPAADGSFDPETVHERVHQRLERLARGMLYWDGREGE